MVENKTALPFFEELYKKVDEELLRVPFQSEDMFFFPAQKKIYEELNKKYKNGIITAGERAIQREILIVENLLRDYTKGGKLIEYNGQK